MNEIISNRLDYSFTPAMRAAGWVFTLLGILTIPIGIGVLITPAALTVAFGTYGIEINLSDGTYRQYTTYVFIKVGKWKSLAPWTSLTILKSRKTTVTTNFAGPSISDTDESYNITLLTENHRKKLTISSCKGVEAAKEEAEKYKKLLNLPYKKYNPGSSNRSTR